MIIFYVYLLKCHNCFKNIKFEYLFYTGHSKNIKQRLEQHLKQRAKYTKRYRGQIDLVYFEVYSTKKDAMKREKEIKDFSRAEKEELSKERYRIFCEKCGNIMLPKHLQNHGDVFQCIICNFWKELKIDWDYFKIFKKFNFVFTYDTDN